MTTREDPHDPRRTVTVEDCMTPEFESLVGVLERHDPITPQHVAREIRLAFGCETVDDLGRLIETFSFRNFAATLNPLGDLMTVNRARHVLELSAAMTFEAYARTAVDDALEDHDAQMRAGNADRAAAALEEAQQWADRIWGGGSQ